MAEVDCLRSRRNLAGLKIFDSTFTASREHVERFCAAIKTSGIAWECEIRADTVDESLLRLMKESGCYYVNVGMETSHARHLKRIAKGITARQVMETLDTCRRIGLRSKVFFTFGHFGETFSECLQDIAFIERNRANIDFFAVTVGMRIYPGTRLERECREKGMLGNRFSWVKSSRRLANLLVFEPGDIPVLFQRQLGPFRLLAVLGLLLCKRLVCTESFLARMLLENACGIVRQVRLHCIYTRHRIERMLGIEADCLATRDTLVPRNHRS